MLRCAIVQAMHCHMTACGWAWSVDAFAHEFSAGPLMWVFVQLGKRQRIAH